MGRRDIPALLIERSIKIKRRESKKKKKNGGQEFNVQNDKVQAEAESHGAKQKWVDPWGHNQQRLVFRQGIDGVAHLNGDQDGKSESHGFGSLENVAAQTLEFFGFSGALEEMAELVVVHLGSGGVVQEPVGSSTDGGETNINTPM